MEGSSGTDPLVGFMCIDQARQLYLLNAENAFSQSLPLIGMWFQNVKINSKLMHQNILNYLGNQSLKKLDTGKQNLLILVFSNDAADPLCYQCVYTACDPAFSMYCAGPMHKGNLTAPLTEAVYGLDFATCLKEICGSYFILKKHSVP
jgi:hypothetical protein